jgi:L-serine dehydratase
MRAAGLLVDDLVAGSPVALADVVSLRIELLGSLGATGLGHGTNTAVLAGLEGARPETVQPAAIAAILARAQETGVIRLTSGTHQQPLAFDPARDVVFNPRECLPFHPNALRFHLGTARGEFARTFYSIGGGFIVPEDASGHPVPPVTTTVALPYAFRTGTELLEQCAAAGISIAELMFRDELARGRTHDEILAGLANLWSVMDGCIETGCRTEGYLPGPLKVRRRAALMLRLLKHRLDSPWGSLDWVSLWALAVGEENAAGGRVVTAPTNGAAGIVPAVLKHALASPGADGHTVADFLLAAAALGVVYQATASISGAEVGCQGEIGVACSMAAAGLAQVLGGSPQQVVNAAEIGMEHHLGLTCDPVGGLVQIPCIERNAIGATTAITAAHLALAGDGRQAVSLDEVIATMMATGRDMAAQYKETSEGGLALSVVAC